MGAAHQPWGRDHPGHRARPGRALQGECSALSISRSGRRPLDAPREGRPGLFHGGRSSCRPAPGGVGGVMALKVSEKSGPIATARVVNGTEEAMVTSASGIVLRTPVASISVQGRQAGGVALMNLKTGDRVACVALLNGHGPAGDPTSEPSDGQDSPLSNQEAEAVEEE